MEETITNQNEITNETYSYAATLYRGGMNSFEVKTALKQRGLDEDNASRVVDNFEIEITKAQKKRAQKDMLYGALWCVGGLALTFAHIGFIFWGAIVFGAIQFFRGVSKL